MRSSFSVIWTFFRCGSVLHRCQLTGPPDGRIGVPNDIIGFYLMTSGCLFLDMWLLCFSLAPLLLFARSCSYSHPLLGLKLWVLVFSLSPITPSTQLLHSRRCIFHRSFCIFLTSHDCRYLRLAATYVVGDSLLLFVYNIYGT